MKMKVINKKIIFLLALVLMVGLTGCFLFRYFYFYHFYGRIKQQLKQTETMIQNDEYGGQTPQETLALFISALEKGNPDEISRYFNYEKQEKMREYYTRLKNENQWSLVLEDLKKLKSANLSWDMVSPNLCYLLVETVGADGSPNKEAIMAFRRQTYYAESKGEAAQSEIWKID